MTGPLPPNEFGLPLFAHGLLKPRELGYHRIAGLVGGYEPASLTPARLRIRDGLPLLVTEQTGRVHGVLLFPAAGKERAFYDAVVAFEPAGQYQPQGFTTVDVDVTGGRQRANVLRARSPRRGSEEFDGSSWSSATDPLFVEGLRVVRQEATRLLGHGQFAALRAPRPADWGLFGPLFRLQATYLLLWTIVERLAAFAEGPDLDATPRLKALEQRPEYEEAFAAAEVTSGRKIIDIRHPSRQYLRLRDDGRESLSGYWYAMRSTVTHRGKAAFRDAELVARAIVGLHDVLRHLLLALLPEIAEMWERSEPDEAERCWALGPWLLAAAATSPESHILVGELRSELASYRHGRKRLLESLNREASNRDPLAEVSERLVAALLTGEPAVSRVQKGHDLVVPGRGTVQVRYLANPRGRWVNEHAVRFDEQLDRYALVVFEDLDLRAVLVFPRATLSSICAALSKRHPGQERCLQLTRRNYRQILSGRDQFEQLGMDVFTFA